MRGTECAKYRNLLEKNIVANNCLLREKNNMLNLLERESVYKKIEIY